MGIKADSELTVESKIKDFGELLEQIDGVSDKKKKLWKEIYENAITDRQNSYVLFNQLVDIVQDKSAEHAIHGRTLAIYIERMSKANDQIIRLAELVSKSEKKDDPEIDPEEMFKKIGG
ncbi:MAG: hypothetical protein EBR82_00410 [Caulobacteraceae bacterium]|jgi:uncharacterized protein YeeX (DUF496 family)|nr:hypothetical protein [Caulobacteraceae bacterium]